MHIKAHRWPENHWVVWWMSRKSFAWWRKTCLWLHSNSRILSRMQQPDTFPLQQTREDFMTTTEENSLQDAQLKTEKQKVQRETSRIRELEVLWSNKRKRKKKKPLSKIIAKGKCGDKRNSTWHKDTTFCVKYSSVMARACTVCLPVERNWWFHCWRGQQDECIL